MRRRQHGEGSLFQRSSDGRWVARVDLGWRDGRRERREFVASTMEEAAARRQAWLDLRRDGFTLPKGRAPYVSEWMLHWLHNIAKRKVEPSTWHRSYRQKVTAHIAPYFERVPLHELDEEMIEGWHAHLERKGLAPATIVQAHRILSTALKVAVVRKRMARNPASNVTPPKIDAAEPMPPDDGEVLAILQACGGRRSGPRWTAAIATGMRQGEALGLLWPYVDVEDAEAASLRVEWEVVRLPWEHGCADAHACGQRLHRYPCPPRCPKGARVSGRKHVCLRPGDEGLCPPGCEGHARSCPGRRGGGLRLKRPKSAKSRRTVPLPPTAAKALREWGAAQKRERLALGAAWRGWEHDPAACPAKLRARQVVCPSCMLPAPGVGLVFAQPDGRPLDPRRDWQDWAELLEDADVQHFGTHANRHGFATHLLEAGMDVKVVSEFMGHSSSDFTRRVYGHVTPRMSARAVEAVERRISGA